MKIFLFGPPGSGKSTLARNLSRQFGINHIDLDVHFFKFEKGLSPDVNKRKSLIDKFTAEDKWIIEGMYSDPWVDDLIKKSKHIFILKPPSPLTFFRLTKRTLKRMMYFEKYERKSNFKILLYLLKMAKDFEERKAEFLQRVEKAGKTVIEIKWKKQAYNFINIPKPF